MTTKPKQEKIQGNIRLMAAHARSVAATRGKTEGNRIVIAVIGEDRPGIMAGVTAVLAARSANILDVSQTIMSDLFTMVMLVDIKAISVPFAGLKTDLEKHGQEAGLSIIVQHEEIFKAMHRV